MSSEVRVTHLELSPFKRSLTAPLYTAIAIPFFIHTGTQSTPPHWRCISAKSNSAPPPVLQMYFRCSLIRPGSLTTSSAITNAATSAEGFPAEYPHIASSTFASSPCNSSSNLTAPLHYSPQIYYETSPPYTSLEAQTFLLPESNNLPYLYLTSSSTPNRLPHTFPSICLIKQRVFYRTACPCHE